MENAGPYLTVTIEVFLGGLSNIKVEYCGEIQGLFWFAGLQATIVFRPFGYQTSMLYIVGRIAATESLG